MLLALATALPAQGQAADAPSKAQSLRDSFGGCLRLGAGADTSARVPCATRAPPRAAPAAAAPVVRTRRDLLPPPPPPLLPPPPPLPPELPPLVPEAPEEAGIDPLLYPPPSARDALAPSPQWTNEPAALDPPPSELTADAAHAAPPPAAPRQDGAVETVVLGAESLFQLSSAVLRPEARLELDSLAAAIRAFPVRGVRVIGHSDRSGPAARNLRLSRQRAEAVRTHLVRRGIPASLIVAEGRGSAEPRTQPADCEGVERARLAGCLQPDRRVEVEVRR